jgi:outer membrane protein OmpA-like peptidoglycan-associated protein
MRVSPIVIFPLFFISLFSFAQDQRAYGDFSVHSDKRTEKKILKSARSQYDYGNYKEAVGKYQELLKLDSINPMYNFELAQAYFNNFLQPASIPYFERTIKYSKDTLGEAFYYLGSAYHLDGKFDRAQKNYRTYLDLLLRYGTELTGDEQLDIADDIKHRIEMCDNGKKLYQTSTDRFVLNGKARPFEIHDAGKNINTGFDDYDAVLSANDSVMYFTSRNDSTTGGKMDWDDKFFEDIFVSKLEKEGWGRSSGIGEPINTDKHEAVISISPDSKTLYFYRGIKQGTFYFSNRVGGYWTKPAILYEKSDMNSKAWETSFYGFTMAGSDLYVVSDRQGGIGKRDIFISHKQADGSWTPLENLGEPINSKYDEDSPFLTPDGKTMYFSSTGHNSMGGFDIFRSEKIGDKWSEPVNLGLPFNTPGDDIYFTLSNRTDRAFYSSSALAKDGTRDMDIYIVDICDEIPAVLITGLAKGLTDGSMVVTDKETGTEAGKFEIKDGKYAVNVRSGKNYTFTLKSSSIEPTSEEVYVPKKCQAYEMYQELAFAQPGQPLVFKNAFFNIKNEAGKTSYSDFIAKGDVKNIPGYSETAVNTIPVAVASTSTATATTGTVTATTATTATTASATSTTTTTGSATITTISINNVLFDYDRAEIKAEFTTELDKVVDFLKNVNKNASIEVAGHSDSKGSDEYNLSLSKRRANAVMNYVSSKGISRARIKAIGYGESKPVASNENPDGSDNPDGRSLNRRTEIVVIQK